MFSGLKQRFQNKNAPKSKYGNLTLISFLATALSRLAYFNDNMFLSHYAAIMGPVFHIQMLKSINAVPANNLNMLLNDTELLGLNNPSNPFKSYVYDSNGNLQMDELKANIVQDINTINGEIKGTVPRYPLYSDPVAAKAQTPQAGVVKYISIGWSDYGEIFIVADKRMPNTIFVLFRGTYSARTTYIYLKPSSLTPKKICPTSEDGFLLGMIKISLELIHTTIQAVQYLATNFLQQTQPNSVKIITTGHSLGGALCTNFAYLWNSAKSMAPYNAAPFNVVSKNIACFSIAAPRSMNESASNHFCNLVGTGQITYLRITTRGDPVPGMPLKSLGLITKANQGFMHPCSTNPNERQKVSEDCNALLVMRPVPNVNYQGYLDCSNMKTGTYAPNPLSHTVYLDILFINAVDIENFLKGIGTQKEVLRGPTGGERVRLILGSQSMYKAIFFDLGATQVASQQGGFLGMFKKPAPTVQQGISTNPNNQTKILEDVKVNLNTFTSLINQMKLIQGDLTPMQGTMANNTTFNTTNLMPDVGCIGSSVTGGQRLQRQRQKHRSLKKRQKSVKRKQTRRTYKRKKET